MTTDQETKQDRAKTSIFIRGIPASASNDDLLLFFSNIGPVKSAFAMSGKSKIVSTDPFCDIVDPNDPLKCGIAHFAVEEDAKKAIEQLSSLNFHGRKLSLEFAKHRHRSDKKANEATEDMEPIEVPKPKFDVQRNKQGKMFNRTVVINGIEHVDKKQLYKKLKKLGNVVQLDFPAMISTANGTPFEARDTAHVRYENPIVADKAVKKLENHVFKGKTMHACIHPNPIEAKKNFRVVIRNIGFKSTLDEICRYFSQFGPILEATLPMNATEADSNRGFCFITFGSKEIADKVMETVNGQKLKEFSKRMLIIDYVSPKSEFVENTATKATEIKSEDAENNSEEENLEDSEIASALGISDTEQPEDDEDVIADSDNDDGVFVEVDGEKIKGSEHESESFKDANQSRKTEQIISNDVEEGQTLFIRNLSFETTNEDLKEKFSEYGHVLYARIVIDRQTGEPKGTGFVKFKNIEDADGVLLSQAQFQDMNVSAYLLPESSSMISLNGRPLFVMRALAKSSLDKDEDTKQTTTTIKSPSDRDKRNIYLLREMLITPKDPIYGTLSEKFLEGLNELYKARVKKLKKQMHMSVSRTRLSVRHMGKTIDEKQLKQIAKKAVLDFKKKFKEDGLASNSPKQLEEFKAWKKEGLFEQIEIKQVKIVRDAVTGKSLGFAFLEFDNHAHALACLRQLRTQKEDVNGKRLVLEFAVENTVILKKRAVRTSQKKADEEKQAREPKTPKDKKDGKPMKNNKKRDDDGGEPNVKQSFKRKAKNEGRVESLEKSKSAQSSGERSRKRTKRADKK